MGRSGPVRSTWFMCRLRSRIRAERAGRIALPNGAVSALVRERGVAETPKIGGRSTAATVSRVGSTPRKAASLRTAS